MIDQGRVRRRIGATRQEVEGSYEGEYLEDTLYTRCWSKPDKVSSWVDLLIDVDRHRAEFVVQEIIVQKFERTSADVRFPQARTVKALEALAAGPLTYSKSESGDIRKCLR